MRDGEAMLAPVPPTIGARGAAPVASVRQWYVLVLLSLVYAMNIADRYVITTVMESIRLDLKLSDSGVALLTGVNGAIGPHETLGVPECHMAYLQMYTPVDPYAAWIKTKIDEWK